MKAEDAPAEKRAEEVADCAVEEWESMRASAVAPFHNIFSCITRDLCQEDRKNFHFND